MMVQEVEIVEVDIDGRTLWVRPVGFLFGNTQLSLALWNIMAGISSANH